MRDMIDVRRCFCGFILAANDMWAQELFVHMSHDCAFYAKVSDLGLLPDVQQKAQELGLRIRTLGGNSELIKIYGSLEDIRQFLKASDYPRKLP